MWAAPSALLIDLSGMNCWLNAASTRQACSSKMLSYVMIQAWLKRAAIASLNFSSLQEAYCSLSADHYCCYSGEIDPSRLYSSQRLQSLHLDCSAKNNPIFASTCHSLRCYGAFQCWFTSLCLHFWPNGADAVHWITWLQGLLARQALSSMVD